MAAWSWSASTASSGDALTRDGRAFSPSVAVHGEVACSIERDDACDVAVVPLDGSAWPDRVSHADYAWDPSWSPDGRALVWNEWDLPNMPWHESRIMRRDAGGKPSVIVEGEGCGQARFSPDGTRLAWVRDGALEVDGQPVLVEPLRGVRAGVVIGRAFVCVVSGERRARVVPQRRRLRSARDRRAGPALRTRALEGLASRHRVDRAGHCVRSVGCGDSAIHRRARAQRISSTRDRARRGRRFRGDRPHRTARGVVEVGGRNGARIVVARVGRGAEWSSTCTAARPGRRSPIGIRASSGSCRTASPCSSRTTAVRPVTAAAYRNALDGQWGVRDVADTAAGIRHAVREGWCDGGRVALDGRQRGRIHCAARRGAASGSRGRRHRVVSRHRSARSRGHHPPLRIR